MIQCCCLHNIIPESVWDWGWITFLKKIEIFFSFNFFFWSADIKNKFQKIIIKYYFDTFPNKNTLKCNNLYHIPKTHLVLSNCTHMAGTGFVLYIKGFWYCCIKVGEDWIRYCTTTHLSLLSRSDQISFVIEGYISCFQFEWNASLGCLLEGFFFPSNWQLVLFVSKWSFSVDISHYQIWWFPSE